MQLAWVSAAEGEKFASKAKEMSEIVKKVSKAEIEKTVKILKEDRLKREAKTVEFLKKRAERKSVDGEGEKEEEGVEAEG